MTNDIASNVLTKHLLTKMAPMLYFTHILLVDIYMVVELKVTILPLRHFAYTRMEDIVGFRWVSNQRHKGGSGCLVIPFWYASQT